MTLAVPYIKISVSFSRDIGGWSEALEFTAQFGAIYQFPNGIQN